MKRGIVGLIGKEDADKAIVAQCLVEKGFHRVSVNLTIKEFIPHLMPEKNSDDTGVFQQIKKRGNKVHKGYWINLALASAPENINWVVIDDIEMDDVNAKWLILCQIVRDDTDEIIPECRYLIRNNGEIDDLRKEAYFLHNKLVRS